MIPRVISQLALTIKNLTKPFKCKLLSFCFLLAAGNNKNSSGDETANVNFYAVRPEATRIR